jgi:hypothetical protein
MGAVQCPRLIDSYLVSLLLHICGTCHTVTCKNRCDQEVPLRPFSPCPGHLNTKLKWRAAPYLCKCRPAFPPPPRWLVAVLGKSFSPAPEHYQLVVAQHCPGGDTARAVQQCTVWWPWMAGVPACCVPPKLVGSPDHVVTRLRQAALPTPA